VHIASVMQLLDKLAAFRLKLCFLVTRGSSARGSLSEDLEVVVGGVVALNHGGELAVAGSEEIGCTITVVRGVFAALGCTPEGVDIGLEDGVAEEHGVVVGVFEPRWRGRGEYRLRCLKRREDGCACGRGGRRRQEDDGRAKRCVWGGRTDNPEAVGGGSRVHGGQSSWSDAVRKWRRGHCVDQRG
jgi:hypothetical protein